MSTQSKVQASESQLLRQQPQAIELQYSQTAQAKPEQHIRTTETVITPPLAQLDTVALVQYGGITAAIILAIAVLILALAEYTKVFVPVMLQKPDDKTKPTFHRNIRSKR
jgi:hypothetical protein